jgi:cytochrome b pre-mRNA-processing protein 3
MLNWFRRKPDATIAALYGAIVAQARAPGFYAGLGVPDTVEGRFDMIVLHLALVMRRLRAGAAEPPRAAQLAIQDLFDHFCVDMDHNLREMGVGDLGVPRRMRKFGEAFYGRAAAYDRALDAGDPAALATALGRNVFGRAAGAEDAPAARLAAYVQRCDALLAEQDAAGLFAGGVRFAAVPAAEAPA